MICPHHVVPTAQFGEHRVLVTFRNYIKITNHFHSMRVSTLLYHRTQKSNKLFCPQRFNQELLLFTGRYMQRKGSKLQEQSKARSFVIKERKRPYLQEEYPITQAIVFHLALNFFNDQKGQLRTTQLQPKKIGPV